MGTLTYDELMREKNINNAVAIDSYGYLSSASQLLNSLEDPDKLTAITDSIVAHGTTAFKKFTDSTNIYNEELLSTNADIFDQYIDSMSFENISARVEETTKEFTEGIEQEWDGFTSFFQELGESYNILPQALDLLVNGILDAITGTNVNQLKYMELITLYQNHPDTILRSYNAIEDKSWVYEYNEECFNAIANTHRPSKTSNGGYATREVVSVYNKSIIERIGLTSPDFMTNKFDTLIYWENDTDLSSFMNEVPENAKGLSVRLSGMNFPFLKNDSYSSNFLSSEIKKFKTTKLNTTTGSLNIRLDTNLEWLKLSQQLSGQGLVKERYAENDPFYKKSVGAFLTSLPDDFKVSIAVFMGHLGGYVNLEKQQETLPYFIYEDVRFLGVNGGFEFSRDSSDIIEIKVDFIYKRAYFAQPNYGQEAFYTEKASGGSSLLRDNIIKILSGELLPTSFYAKGDTYVDEIILDGVTKWAIPKTS